MTRKKHWALEVYMRFDCIIQWKVSNHVKGATEKVLYSMCLT